MNEALPIKVEPISPVQGECGAKVVMLQYGSPLLEVRYVFLAMVGMVAEEVLWFWTNRSKMNKEEGPVV